MIKTIKIIAILAVSFLLFFCADKVNKNTGNNNQPRIEYSDCTQCGNCTTMFECPENAILLDDENGAYYIDKDKCISCMKCIDLFADCEGRDGTVAFTTAKDINAPADINDFKVVSENPYEAVISFTAPGDDGMTGYAYKYKLSAYLDDMTDTRANDDDVDDVDDDEYDDMEEVEIPCAEYAYYQGGTHVEWVVDSLNSDYLLTVRLQVEDEAGNKNTEVERSTIIAGLITDETAPAAISDLAAVSNEESIELSWSAVGDDDMTGTADHYIIKYSQTSPFDWDLAEEYNNSISPQTAGISENLVIDDLEVGISFEFAIKAVDESDNESELSNIAVASITGDVTPPSTVSDLATELVTASSARIIWTAPGDNGDTGTATEYIIKVSEADITDQNWDSLTEFPHNYVPSQSGSDESLLITNLTSDTEYYIGIKSIDDSDNISGLSNIVSFTTDTVADTLAPADITDLQLSLLPASMELTWTSTGDDGNTGTSEGYEIKKSTTELNSTNWDSADPVSCSLTPQANGNQESFEITDIEVGTLYYFGIKAFDEAGNYSGISNIVSGQLTADDTPPSAITDLQIVASAALNGRLRVTWTAPGDDADIGTAASYDIRYSQSPITDANWDNASPFSSSPAPGAAGTTQTCDVNGISNGTRYYIAIKAIDDSNNYGSISNIVSGKIVYIINPNQCADCNSCLRFCPEDAISDVGNYKTIDTAACDACGTCYNRCGWNAIHLGVHVY